MNELKATPGPWVAEIGETYNVRAPHGGMVAQIRHLKGRYGMDGRVDPNEAAANAALITAAWDMYQELAHIENELFSIVEALRMDGRLIGAMTKAGASNALAALEARCIAIQAKARGE